MAIIKPLQTITLKNEGGEDTTYVVASAPAIVETTEPASVASFSDGAEGIPVKSLLADINPVQNLNGQSAPYPAGGGKNKCSVNEITHVGWATANTSLKDSLNALPNGTYELHIVAKITEVTKQSWWQFGIEGQNSGGNITLRKTVSGAPTVGQTETYNASFTITDANRGNFTAAYVYGCGNNSDGRCGYANLSEIQIESGSSFTSYAPYSNICPITGWTGMNVTRTGKNLFNKNATPFKVGSFISNASTVGSIPTYTENGNYNCYKIQVAPNTTYSFGLIKANTACYALVDLGGLITQVEQYNGGTSGVNKTITTGANDAALILSVAVVGQFKCDDVLQLELGSTATTYEPYNGTTYPISWADEAGTVYGGTLDVTTGLLTVTHGIVEYDGSADESWTKGGGANECYIRNDAVKRFLDYRGQLFCDKLATYWHHETFVAQYGISAYGANDSYPSQNWLYVHLTDTTLTVADLKTWLQSNPITVCYPLATPQTHQLTPQAVMTILGQNNIWADTGDVEVAYCADTKMYIDKVIAAL